jgi:hypothetical protein
MAAACFVFSVFSYNPSTAMAWYAPHYDSSCIASLKWPDRAFARFRRKYLSCSKSPFSVRFLLSTPVGPSTALPLPVSSSLSASSSEHLLSLAEAEGATSGSSAFDIVAGAAASCSSPLPSSEGEK